MREFTRCQRTSPDELLKCEEPHVGECAGMSLGARTSRDIVLVVKIVELPANETTDWA
jgi:hypothetical protein